MSRIFITGDTHGETDKNKLSKGQFNEQQNLTKDDYVIICGDVAILWSSYTPFSPKKISLRDDMLISWYTRQNYTTLFIDGNHENHYALNKYPVEMWNGGKVHKISPSIIHLMRGQVYNIDGKTFFTMGGAESIDKMYRTLNESYWKEEMPTLEEYKEAIDNLEKHNMEVDYILTHDCGSSYSKELCKYSFDTNELNQFLDRLEFTFNVKFKHWYFGHHHVDKDLDQKHTCLYDNIVEIY